jgi:glycosyltransferase involved in cell wall biosynthesis
MRIGIDGSNLRGGGSLTHLGELLEAARPERHSVDGVVVWGGRSLTSGLPRRDWLQTVHVDALDGPLPVRVAWQQTQLARMARRAACDLLFAPGGTYLGDFRPFVTMSQNLLPFDLAQARLYGTSPTTTRLLLLRLAQSRTFRRADGTIFLNAHARAHVARAVPHLDGLESIIPHGVSIHFRTPPRPQRPLHTYSERAPFRLLYVSSIDPYKHHEQVAQAVASLVARGMPITLELVGPATPAALRRLSRDVERAGAGSCVHYSGAVPYVEVRDAHARADAFIFASSCENMPITLLEAMAAGLPIACSNREPMPAILGAGGVYFDPNDATDIARALGDLVASPETRSACAASAFERARAYTWERCAQETFAFLCAVT